MDSTNFLVFDFNTLYKLFSIVYQTSSVELH